MRTNDFMNELQQEAHPKKEELLENVSTPLEKSNNYAAEHVANGLASLTRAIGIIVGIIGLMAGIVMFSSFGDGLIGALCIIFGLIFFLICLVSWAFIKLMVNMSYRLTRIDNKLKN
jgi:membrane-bound ClpP family serine protease